MKKLFLSVVALMMVSSTYAVNLTFKFDVWSSGNSMYACNAGLKHPAYNNRVCYERDNLKRSCEPKQCKAGEVCNCVCTGGITNFGNNNDGQGEYLLDYFKFSAKKWADNGEALGAYLANNKSVKGGVNNFATVAGDLNKAKFGTVLTDLSFYLGSERYGAEYFVDVCYRSTQIEYNGVTPNYSFYEAVTITDLTARNASYSNDWNGSSVLNHQTKYQTLANLYVKAETYCKVKGSSQVREVADSGWKRFDGQAKKLAEFSKKQDLAGCYVRYSFKENNRGESSNIASKLASLRKWKKQGARICTYTSINEPAAN